MLCPKCAAENPLDAMRCSSCGDSLSVAVLEVVRGDVPEKIRFLRPRPYTLGRARTNDLSVNEPSISKFHARLDYRDGVFSIEDAGSLHGVYVNAKKVRQAVAAVRAARRVQQVLSGALGAAHAGQPMMAEGARQRQTRRPARRGRPEASPSSGVGGREASC
jgi:hypothetical protein